MGSLWAASQQAVSSKSESRAMAHIETEMLILSANETKRKQAEEREKAKMAAYEQKQHGLTKADIKEAVKEAVMEALREVMAEWKK